MGLYNNPVSKSLSLNVVIVLFSSYRLPRKMRCRFVICYGFNFFLSFFHGKPSKPNTDMPRLNLTARGDHTVPCGIDAIGTILAADVM